MSQIVPRLLFAAMLVGATLGPSHGQAPAAQPSAPSAPAPQAAPTGTLSPETKALRDKLDALKLDLAQNEAALQNRELSDAELQRVRQEADAAWQTIRALIDDLQPRLDAARARLEQLGPRPKEDQQESADIQRDRAGRESAVAELDDTQRLARALLVQAEQITTQTSDRRRAAFARSLMHRSWGLLSPDLWSAVARGLARDMVALRLLFESWSDRVARNAGAGVLTLAALALGVAIALYGGRRFIAPHLVRRDPAAVDVPQMKRLLTALAVLVVGALPAAAGSYLVYAALDVTGLMPPRVDRLVAIFLASLAFVALAHAIADAILAPGRSAWRLVRLADAPANRTATFVVVIAVIIAGGKVIEALNQAIAAGLAITVATKGFFALLAALALAELLRRFSAVAAIEEECLGPYVPTESEVGWPIRIAGWAAVGVVIASLQIGYVAFASFLVDQIVWIALIFAALALAIAFADEFVGGALMKETRIATALQANTGLRRRSLEQIGILAIGVGRVALIVLALMLVLAPWGVDSMDIVSSVRAAFFGFKVGEVTISLSTIVFAVLMFALGFAVTRIIQNWLNHTFLPATDLDAGIRNSIGTAFGYLGFFIAAALAFSYLGLSLDKIAIVAGALSVGIGFGLQSIVNNFVSGLILLWERPIRVGDLVVVGDGEGHVRRISVRSTEIETFDRSTLIVPNSNLISGVVKNRVRVDRTGRVIVAVNVLRNQDPARAAELLAGCAQNHPDVLKQPPPRVVFKKIGETWLEFELVAYVSDVNLQQSVQSDLNFAVFRCIAEAGLMPPLAAPSLNVQGLEPVHGALREIAGAIANTAGAGETKPSA